MNTIARGFFFNNYLIYFIMNKEFMIENLQEFRDYLIDILLNGLEGQQLGAVDKELYKMCVSSINFLIDFLKR